jgi:PAS domain S-box-containing protein/putative nucleotidyltransferase with HDIG domain
MTKPAIQILMVEDSETDALLLEEILNRDTLNSFEFTRSERLKSGLEMLYKHKFDLVLLDLGLPDSQGLETFEKLHKEFPDMPVVVLSGLVDEKLAFDAIQAGAQDYLVKGPTSWEIAPRAIRYAIERQQSQAALRESESLLKESQIIAGLGNYVLDISTGTWKSSEVLDKLFGIDEAFDRSVGGWATLIHPDDRQLMVNYLTNEVLGRRVRFDKEYKIIRNNDRAERWVHGLGDLEVNADNQVVKMHGTIEDITERKQAEEKLNRSENRYRLATKATNDVIWEWDAKTHQLIWTENAQVVFGYSPEEVGPDEKWWDEHIHPDDREHILQKLDALLTGDGSIWAEEYRFLLKGGSYAHVSDHAYVERDTDGEPLRMIGAMSDITERKRAERLLDALNRSAAAMAHALTPDEVFAAASSQLKAAGLQCVVLPLDESSDNYVARYLSIAPELLHKLEKLTGIKHRDFHIPIEASDVFQQVRFENHAVIVEDAEPLVRQALPKPLKGLAVQIVKAMHYPKYIAAPMTIDDTFVGVFAAQSHDLSEKDMPAITAFADQMAVSLRKAELFQQAQNEINERKRAEEAIRLSEKKFKTLFEIAPVGISVLDQEQNIIDANYSLQRITGLSNNKLLDGTYRKRTYLRPDGTVMSPDEFASARAFKENMPIFDIETGIVTEDRGVIWTQVSAAPLDMPDAGLVVITQDISERKQAEETLRQRLAELETLYESGLILSQITNPQKIAQKLIALMTEKLQWHHVTIRRYHAEDGSLELLAFNHPDIISDKKRRTIEKRFQSMISKSGEGLSGWVVQHGRTVRSGNLSQDSRYREVEPGLQSGLFVPMKIGNQIMGVISIESEFPEAFTEADERLISTLAAQAAVTLDNIQLFEDLQKSNDRIFRAYDDTIEGWSNALDLRDKETEGHTLRVTTLTEELAREMGIPDSNMIHIRRGALLHDIGKMGVPDRILLKPDKLTDDEWVIMREHPVYAYNLLSQIDFLRPALSIPHHHHEKWDGSGYPDGLKGKQIPLAARIFAIVDVFDALTSDRPYRPAWSKERAIDYIREQSGSQFDPKVVEAFMKLIGTTESA